MRVRQLFLVSLMVSASAAVKIENGHCDENFCACVVPVAVGDPTPECPSWMTSEFEGWPYDDFYGFGCFSTNNAGTVVTESGAWGCFAYKDKVFKNSIDRSTPCYSGPSGSSFPSWIVRDGNEVLVNYTAGGEQLPECSEEMPFTVSPTMAPTDGTNPPTASGGAISNYVAASLVAAAALFVSLLP